MFFTPTSRLSQMVKNTKVPTATPFKLENSAALNAVGTITCGSKCHLFYGKCDNSKFTHTLTAVETYKDLECVVTGTSLRQSQSL